MIRISVRRLKLKLFSHFNRPFRNEASVPASIQALGYSEDVRLEGRQRIEENILDARKPCLVDQTSDPQSFVTAIRQ